MKKLTLIAFSILSVKFGYSQKLTLAPSFTAGMAFNTYEITGTNLKQQGMVNLGVNAGLELNSHIAFYTGFGYSVYRYAYESSSGVKASQELSSSFISIPIGIIANTSKPEKVGFSIDAGVSFNFNLNNTSIIKVQGLEDSKTTTKEGFTSTLTMLNIYPSINIPLSNKANMLIGPGFGFSFNDQFEVTKDTQEKSLHSYGGRVTIITRL